MKAVMQWLASFSRPDPLQKVLEEATEATADLRRSLKEASEPAQLLNGVADSDGDD